MTAGLPGEAALGPQGVATVPPVSGSLCQLYPPQDWRVAGRFLSSAKVNGQQSGTFFAGSRGVINVVQKAVEAADLSGCYNVSKVTLCHFALGYSAFASALGLTTLRA